MGVLSRFNGVFYGYWVLLGCFLIHAVGFRAFFYAFAVVALFSAVTLFFVRPIEGARKGVSGGVSG